MPSKQTLIAGRIFLNHQRQQWFASRASLSTRGLLAPYKCTKTLLELAQAINRKNRNPLPSHPPQAAF